jgi:drug/metabolite transporter (DMT)-like permease
MSTALAVVTAIGASLLFNYAMYLQKKEVVGLPEVKFQLSWSVTKAFITNKGWILSMVVILLGSGLYAVALDIAPVSIVQPIMAAGVALLAYLAIKNLGEHPRRQDLFAIGLSILGVVLIAISLIGSSTKTVTHNATVLWVFTAAAVAVAAVIPLLFRKRSPGQFGAALGISVGILYGTSAVFAKLMLTDWGNRWAHHGIASLFQSVFILAWALTLIPAFIILQAALQKGMAIVVVPILAGLNQLVPILLGMFALNEKLPTNAVLATVRIISFCMILTSTIILSRRAEEASTAPLALEESALMETPGP